MKKIISLALLLIATLFIASCNDTSNPDIINPNAKYLYFYGATCPHCQELNRKLEESGILPKLSLEKREVYYNKENNKLFLKTAKNNGIDTKKVGVPFILEKETGKYTIGADQWFEMLSNSLKK